MLVPGKPRVLIVGGGVAALETVLALRELAEDRVELELLAPGPDFVYRPLATAETFDLGGVYRVELARLLEELGVRYHLDAVREVDTVRRRARTEGGAELEYDIVVIACGARPQEALPGALTFRGEPDQESFRQLLEELSAGEAKHVVFAVPGGVVWPLPLYELALMTAGHLAEHGVTDVELTLVTPEAAPLHLFGEQAGGALRTLLETRGIALRTSVYPALVEGSRLTVVAGDPISADRVVALPRLEGPRVPGIPHDLAGFISTDSHGLVRGLFDVYAAGDATAFPVKQGGVAAQQADAVAEMIAARAGAPVTPRPFEPVLRGLLLTGEIPRFLRAELAGGRGETSVADTHALWWPPSKIAGRYLAPYLAEHAGFPSPVEPLLSAARISRSR